MRHLIRRLRKSLAHCCVDSLERKVATLPSRDHERAAKGRLRYYETHLREGTSWRVSKQVLRVRLRADAWLQGISGCERRMRLAIWFNPEERPSEKLKSSLARVSGEDPSNSDEDPSDFKAVAARFGDCRTRWKKIVTEARRITIPVFASQAFLQLSERGRLQIASMVIGGLIVLGAVQMLFFYGAAAQQFVSAYWVWDDLVIQALNIAPFIVGLLVLVELLFRQLWRFAEMADHPGLAVWFFSHPVFLVVMLFLGFVICASLLGYIQGEAVWSHFQKTGGYQSATILDETRLAGVHLVGTTSRAAVFLQAKTANTEKGRTAKQRAKSMNNDRVRPYSEVAQDLVCALAPWCTEERPSRSTYRVYVMDRDKIVCHSEEGLCEQIPVKNAVTSPR